jgi:acyl dehydratase
LRFIGPGAKQPKLQAMTTDFFLNATHQHLFRFSQTDVDDFARVTGDNNPLHLDAEFAAQTPFKRPIIHGMLGASIFTKVLGTEFPGYGSVYLGQTLEFLRPMFVDTDYEATFTVQTINPDKHTAQILGEISDKQTGKVTTRGVATLMHQTKI